ncbi:FBD-associated F-box protein At3g52670-like isoform X2 [Quercus robur]|uniref:FBD-associated F-box protein At3g52670-like isoform X2 n=1 Tax=Quercus robur TaxID=38942 RepID=UPI00216203BA|nr:FBD-associated F-box protein At3g52670-like isoform X2 [Quercus robur]
MVRNKKRDRISNLPDLLVSHILSFLTTKEAVATSILSSRWKTLWTLVPNLDLDEDEFEWILSDEKQNRKRKKRVCRSGFTFVQIVSKIWALRNAYPLQKFYLNWLYDCDPIHVDKWVSTAITSVLEELTLNICPHLPFDIPSTLFNYCKTLVDLRLHGNIIVDPPPSSLGFPSLKILHLLGVQYANHDSFSRFLTCCPILEYLYLKVIEMDEECNFIITLPTLKRLDLNMQDFLYKLEINAPALEYLEFVGFLHKVVLLENLSNLVKAVLFVSYDSEVGDTEDYGNRVMDFIRALYNVKSLHLGSFTTEDKGHLHSTSEQESLKWNFSEYVPKCLSSHLTALQFKGFKGLKDELELIGHILQMARVLKTMTLSSDPSIEKEKIRVLKELVMFPRHSSTCQITFN